MVKKANSTAALYILRLLFVGLCLSNTHLGFAPNYNGSTAAGTGSAGNSPSQFGELRGVFVDSNGFLSANRATIVPKVLSNH